MFLNHVEQKCGIDELEILGVVWPLEYLKHYLQGAESTLRTDHQALLTAPKKKEVIKPTKGD